MRVKLLPLLCFFSAAILSSLKDDQLTIRYLISIFHFLCLSVCLSVAMPHVLLFRQFINIFSFLVFFWKKDVTKAQRVSKKNPGVFLKRDTIPLARPYNHNTLQNPKKKTKQTENTYFYMQTIVEREVSKTNLASNC